MVFSQDFLKEIQSKGDERSAEGSHLHHLQKKICDVLVPKQTLHDDAVVLFAMEKRLEVAEDLRVDVILGIDRSLDLGKVGRLDELPARNRSKWRRDEEGMGDDLRHLRNSMKA
jgi:hypothetical protein